ncbi:hypothetical protein [Kosakonia cowanii]|uniref:hypothetical protein n=1 Tax=Kosakonia cowanii TaxID=208223 RepID=UPI0028977651|nr:hypothetical protein [Kosakonia cowanii]
MVNIKLTRATIRHNGGDGLTLMGQHPDIEIELTDSHIHDNRGSGIAILPSPQELHHVGIDTSVSYKELKKAQKALEGIDPNDQETISERLSKIGFAGYLSVAANLTTVAQFLMNIN